ncbi:MAG: hypothetical protein FWD90_05420 [Defluviitaleaceae bacterium]|nr:hypothetical protein [Defluviitaleaceae bacterium]
MRNIYILCAAVVLVVAAVIVTAMLWPPKFEYELRPIVAIAGERVYARAFLADTEVMTDTHAYHLGESAFYAPAAPGRHGIPITLWRDSNFREVTATLYIAQPVEYITVEWGEGTAYGSEGFNLDPLSFIANVNAIPKALLDFRFLSFSSYWGMRELPVGNHTAHLVMSQYLNGDEFAHFAHFTSEVRVVDTTPPTAVTRDITMQMGREITPDDIVVSVFDLSPIRSVEVINQPDIFTPGEYTVEVRATDIHGNAAVFSSVVTLLPNTVPPVFTGVQDIKVMQGEPIRFRAGVEAQDAFGRPIPFEIDATRVNTQELGIHTATYTAADAWGLETSVTINVHILNVDPEAVIEMVDNLLITVLRGTSTQAEQARAIHDWIGDHISFAAAVGMDSAYEAAYHAILHRQGNCFVFNGLAEMMLTRAGIPNLRIDRILETPNPTRHRWTLINPDGMGWYHLDVTSNRVLTRNERFMFTNSQAEAFTLRFAQQGTHDFYTFNPVLYPVIVP